VSISPTRNPEGYEEALGHYADGLEADPTNHVLFANRAACFIEIANDEYVPFKKVEAFAKALREARACTGLNDVWAKGFLRQVRSSFSLPGRSFAVLSTTEEDIFFMFNCCLKPSWPSA